MDATTTAAMVAQAEGLIALAGLADALRAADGVDLRHAASDPARVGSRLEVTVSFASANAASEFFAAARKVVGTT